MLSQKTVAASIRSTRSIRPWATSTATATSSFRALSSVARSNCSRHGACCAAGLCIRSGRSGIMSSRTISPMISRTQLRCYASSGDLPAHTVINMPALSPTMTSGNIGEWAKKSGDEIQPGDVLVEIETDKAQMDFECQEEGFLAKVLIGSGAKDVAVNTPIAILVENKEDVDAFKDYVPTAKPAETAPKAAAPEPVAASTPAAAASAAPAAASTPASAPAAGDAGRVLASPLARTMANERNIPLGQVQGSGPGGRVVKTDIDSWTPTATATAAAASPAAPAPMTGSTAAFTDLPLSNMRKVIASRLLSSKQTVPHYYLTVEVGMDKVLKLREVLNAQSNGTYKLSVNDFIIKATALALQQIPEVNSSWQDTFIRQFHSSDISVAVATESGLITPIVKSAHAKGLSTISNTVKELALRAKENKLKPEEYQGGSFTISNLGMFGIDHFTAIINPPQACILAVGGTADKVVPKEDGEGFEVRKVMKVTMSCDHRVVDGAVGSKWLGVFKKLLEQPLNMLL